MGTPGPCPWRRRGAAGSILGGAAPAVPCPGCVRPSPGRLSSLRPRGSGAAGRAGGGGGPGAAALMCWAGWAAGPHVRNIPGGAGRGGAGLGGGGVRRGRGGVLQQRRQDRRLPGPGAPLLSWLQPWRRRAAWRHHPQACGLLLLAHTAGGRGPRQRGRHSRARGRSGAPGQAPGAGELSQCHSLGTRRRVRLRRPQPLGCQPQNTSDFP